MTRQEALVEAQRRWGPEGRAMQHGYPTPGHIFEVWALPYSRGIYGAGDSFEAAFKDAEQRTALLSAAQTINRLPTDADRRAK